MIHSITLSIIICCDFFLECNNQIVAYMHIKNTHYPFDTDEKYISFHPILTRFMKKIKVESSNRYICKSSKYIHSCFYWWECLCKETYLYLIYVDVIDVINCLSFGEIKNDSIKIVCGPKLQSCRSLKRWRIGFDRLFSGDLRSVKFIRRI